MKIAKNNRFGGFSLSPKATKRLAELNGKECYFFKGFGVFIPITEKEAEKESLFWSAYSVPNPQGYRLDEIDEDGLYTEANKRAEEISIDNSPSDRTDPKLIQVIEELGKEANGACAEIVIVEIPDGIDWEISEYDGLETIHEKHRSW